MDGIYIAIICAGCAAFIGLCALFAWYSNNKITVTRYSLNSPKIPEGGLKIVHLSDLHAKRFGKKNCRLLKKVAAQEPDFIAITGDVIHKYRPRDIEVAKEAVKGLSKISPVFYVSGNHEMRNKNYRALREALKGAGATVLDDEAVSFSGVDICGVNCANIRAGKYCNLSNGDGYKILLAHLPQYIEGYAEAGYDLILCGHAHGGQWRIPFTEIGVYSPGQGLFPKYASGVHGRGETAEVISRGLGNSECPIRLFNTPEIVVITLRRK